MNRFALLAEDDEPQVKSAVSKTADAKKQAPPAHANPAKPVKASVPAVPAGAVAEDAAPGRAQRGGKPPSGGGRGKGREGWSGRGREFDRHSGTGRGKEVAKNGAGSHAVWGSTADAVKYEAEGAAAEAPAAEEEAIPEVPEEPDNSLSFEAFQAQRAAKREGDLFTVVKEDTSKLKEQFKGLKLKSKDEDDLAFLTSGKLAQRGAKAAGEKAEKPVTVDATASMLAFQIKNSAEVEADKKAARSAARPDRPERTGPKPVRAEGGAPAEGAPKREDRAPRGAPRGGARGRGGAPRGAGAPRPSGPRVNVADTAAFPSL